MGYMVNVVNLTLERLKRFVQLIKYMEIALLMTTKWFTLIQLTHNGHENWHHQYNVKNIVIFTQLTLELVGDT